jgi:hypothetical protein
MSALNNSLLLGQEGGGGYSISRSVRLNAPDSAFFSRTPASAGNRKTWTWAGWVKLGNTGTGYQVIFNAQNGTSTGLSNNFWLLYGLNRLQIGDGVTDFFYTSNLLRDPSAWYHLVLSVDTTQATASNRAKLYVNGTEASYSTDSRSSITQNADTTVNSTFAHKIGDAGTSLGYFSGYLADIHFIDGQALDPTSFGEFDDNGIWQPIEYTGSYGTNGFHLDFADNSSAAALGTDSSGNGNTWTVNNIVAGPTTTSNSWSGFFNGSSSTPMYVADNDAFTFNADFTVECWVKPSSTSAFQTITSKWDVGGQEWLLAIDSGGVAEFHWAPYSVGGPAIESSSGVIAAGVWSHVAAVRSSGIITLYVNGVSVGTRSENSAGTNYSTLLTVGYLQYLGGDKLTGYISNLRILKGTAVYTGNFTVPTEALVAITNTSLLTLQSSTFVDNSANNLSITTNGVTVSLSSPFEESSDTDSFVDVPTNGSEVDTGSGGQVRGNYCTLNPLGNGSSAAPTSGLSNGNLQHSGSTTGGFPGTFAIPVGKWYWEVTLEAITTPFVGVCNDLRSLTADPGITLTNEYGFYFNPTINYMDGSSNPWSTGSVSNGDVIGVAVDATDYTNIKLWLSKNNTWYSSGGGTSGNPGAGTNAIQTITANKTLYPFCAIRGTPGSSTMQANFGQRSWAYQAPSGFKALCTANLPAPVVTKPSTVMDVLLWTGNNSSGRSITGLGFNPDLVWIKSRSNSGSHAWFDALRSTNMLASNDTGAESSFGTPPVGGYVSAFNTDGFTLTNGSVNNTYVNESSYTYAGWCWDAGSSTVTNTAGSISSQVRANASAGFSIVTYTGAVASPATVGHGLNATPSFVIVKPRSTSDFWVCYHSTFNNLSKYIVLNSTAAVATAGATYWGTSSDWNSSTFGVNALANGSNNLSGATHVAYCFAPVAGYSSAFSFTGNGSTDGPMCYLGFRPRLILLKRTDSTSYWHMYDTARNTYNVADANLWANGSDAEISNSAYNFDLLSNGFKVRTSDAARNASGGTYVGFAWAESPFQYARAR